MSKYCKVCGKLNGSPLNKWCSPACCSEGGGYKTNKKPLKVKFKKTGEKELFEKIWDKRLHKCVKCGRVLRTPRIWNFAHIKSKGSRPDLRLAEENIQILCFKCHFKEDHGLEYKGPDLDL